MEEKKTPKADLNRKTGMHLSIGLVISLAVVTLAFEWKSYDNSGLVDLGTVENNFEDVMEIPPTEQPPPPPPKIQQPEIIAVPDEEEIEDDIEIDLDVEITEDTQIEEMVFEEAPEEEATDQIFMVVEDQPEPQGGMQAFYNFVGKNMQYPAQARRMGIEGKVFVQFVVNTDGSLTDVKAIKGIGAGCDDEAVRVIKSAPKWKPGKQRGRAVRVRMVLPITFKLG